MKKKIYSAIILSSAVSAIMTFIPLFIAVRFSFSSQIDRLFIVLSIVCAIFSALIFASLLSKKIVSPIENIDIDKPQINKSYGEIDSLIHKISRQNQLIGRQMEDMRRRQIEFNAITENMSEGIVILDDKSEILSYNSAALSILGADRVKEGEHFISLSRSRRFVAAVGNAFEGRHGESTLSIGQRVFQILANPVTVKNEVCGAVILLLDITEKEKREEIRREFSSNVSHELKTPLTTISGISELFMNKMVSNEDIPKFAANINSEAARLLELINDIIKLSRLDETDDPELPDEVNLKELANEIKNRLLLPAEEKNVLIEIEGQEITVLGNRSVLDEMIYNLTDNAIKYNKDGGRVKITAKYENGLKSLSVSDTGIGIPAEHHNRIFERFYRVDKSHSKEVGGTGLGLSIVRHAAEYHKATLSIESEIGVGTKITVTFPN